MNTELINRIKQILDEYYGIIIKQETIKLIWNNHPELTEYEKSGYDTDFRESLIDDLSSFLNLDSYPIYGDTEEYKENYKRDFIKESKKFNIEVRWL